MKRLSNMQEKIEREANRATRWIGSTKSILFHSIFFIIVFLLPLFGADFERVLLILTTALSLEAIYLAIFIQMTVNKNTEDIDEIQEDIEEIQKDVDEIQEDIEDIEEGQEKDDHAGPKKDYEIFSAMQATLKKLSEEIEQLKKK